MRILFLINTRSGGSLGVGIFRRLQEYAYHHPDSISVRAVPIEEEEQRELAAQHQLVIIGGGDGTVSSVLSQLVDCPVKIGILPLGTGNDLAREFGLVGKVPIHDIAELCDFYHSLESRDLMLFEVASEADHSIRCLFTNYLSFGFDARVVSDFNRLRSLPIWAFLRSVWGNRFGYALSSLRNSTYSLKGTYSQIESSTQEITDVSSSVSVIFANIRSIMGLGISNPYSNPSDDSIECIVVRSQLEYLSMILRYRMPFFRPLVKGGDSQWKILKLSPHVLVQVDGEPKPELSGHTLRIVPFKKVQMLVCPQR